MTAYIVAFIEMLDQEKFKEYQGVASKAFASYGAKFLVRGGSHVVLEGPDENRTCVVIEFPSVEKAMEFADSPEYAAAVKLREGAAKMQMLLLEGAG